MEIVSRFPRHWPNIDFHLWPVCYGRLFHIHIHTYKKTNKHAYIYFVFPLLRFHLYCLLLLLSLIYFVWTRRDNNNKRKAYSNEMKFHNAFLPFFVVAVMDFVNVYRHDTMPSVTSIIHIIIIGIATTIAIINAISTFSMARCGCVWVLNGMWRHMTT